MSATDVFLLIVRWLHIVAAAAWVGGGIFYLVVLRPAARRSQGLRQAMPTAVATEFRVLVDVCVVVLVATGAILAFNRLTGEAAEVPYVVTLGIKVALSVWMFQAVLTERRRAAIIGAYLQAPQGRTSKGRGLLRFASGYDAITIVGVVVFLLSDLLNVLFQLELARD